MNNGQRASDDLDPRHPIRVVSNRTGLTASTLRAWERRYGTVDPGRSEGGQRLYSDRDIEKLDLLRRLTEGGRSIGTVAHLDLDDIRELAAEDAAASRPWTGPAGATATDVSPSADPDTFKAQALAAVGRMDGEGLEAVLRRSVVVLGGEAFTDRLLAPLLVEIGERWAAGELRPAHEHVATAVMRRVLAWMAAPAGDPPGPPVVVGTLPGEEHEMGALLAATAAALEGWSVTYLGQGLPPADIAAAVRVVDARVVGVSVVNPLDGSEVVDALRTLRRLLDPEVALVVGGRAGDTVAERADSGGVTAVESLAAFRTLLRAAR